MLTLPLKIRGMVNIKIKNSDKIPNPFSYNFLVLNCAPTIRPLTHITLTGLRIFDLSVLSRLNFSPIYHLKKFACQEIFYNVVVLIRRESDDMHEDILPVQQVQAHHFQLHISYFLQKCKKGKPSENDLPLLKNDLSRFLWTYYLHFYWQIFKV